MKKTALIRSISLLCLSAIVLIASSIFFISCNDDKGEHSHGAEPPKINCVMLSRAQIQAWVDSGWTKPGVQGQINDVVLQFMGANGGSSLQLIGYPGSSAINVKDNGKVSLSADTTCSVKPFTGDIILGNNILKLADLKIFNADGSLKNFDTIRFTPEQQYPPYINFKVEIVTRGQVESGGGGTKPCPVWCS